VTRYWIEVQPEPFKRGFRESMRFYGSQLATMEFAYVNGFAYRSVTPVGPDQLAERFRRAEEVFTNKLWREQVLEWDEKFKPASIKIHRELQAVDPDGLSDTELVTYLTRCRDHHAEMIYQHRRFTGVATIPTGDLLAHAEDWSGLPAARLVGMLRGSAPVSAGASGELERLIATLEPDAEARELLESDGEPSAVLNALGALDRETGSALRAYIELVGYRLLDGFDISGPYALELPEALVRAIRAALAAGSLPAPDVAEQIAEVRAQVPARHRDHFDELLEDARLTYRIRDERGVFSDIWAAGIVRRAVLAAGRRLASKERIHDPEHLIDAGFAEMVSLLSAGEGPSADELERRAAYRASHTAKEAPATLGPPPSHADPADLPPAAARGARAMAVVMGSLFESSDAKHEERVLRGIAASGGVYEGPARRVSGPAQFDLIVQGDVLVTESTTEAFNILLPLLGAIVTDSGGLLSHPAIVAREYGIPGVVGTREATERIADGDRVRVDGDAGVVMLQT
jgi:pyruvate,water dikinase